MYIYASVWAHKSGGKRFLLGERDGRRQGLKEKNKVGENSQQEVGMPLTVAGLWLCLLSFHDKLTPAPLPVSASLQQKMFHTPYTMINLLTEFTWRELIHHRTHSCREKMGKAVGKNQGQTRSPFGEKVSQVHWFGRKYLGSFLSSRSC